jgi:serine/threonine-protein kinase HipA
VIQRLNLGYPALAEMYRRMVFNVVARNQDDHTRNIAFLMDSNGAWRLAPAFDVVWACNPKGSWTSRHQMTVNGKRDQFVRTDLLAVSDTFGVRGATEIIEQVTEAVAAWRSIALECGVESALLKKIATAHRTTLAGG